MQGNKLIVLKYINKRSSVWCPDRSCSIAILIEISWSIFWPSLNLTNLCHSLLREPKSFDVIFFSIQTSKSKSKKVWFRSKCRFFQVAYEGDFWSLCTVTKKTEEWYLEYLFWNKTTLWEENIWLTNYSKNPTSI